METCDTVFVEYHSAGGELIADNVDDDGTSLTGAICGPGNGASDETGPITAISPTSVTITTGDQGPMTFAVQATSGLTAGFQLGDVVDVTYVTDPNGATLDAADVEYVESDEIGVVTAVTTSSLTITDGVSGHTDTFSANASVGAFGGIDVGDEVDVTFHTSSAQAVVDNVEDLTSDGTWTN